MINAINTQAVYSTRGQQRTAPHMEAQKPVTQISTIPMSPVPGGLFEAQAKTNMMPNLTVLPNLFAQAKPLTPNTQGAGRTLNLIG
jgi:hypothetical protein